MGSCKNIYPNTSVVTDHFKFIPFVVSSADKGTTGEGIQKSNACGQLSGLEASQFYEEIISTPSTSVNSLKISLKKKCNVKTKKAIPEISRHSIFYHAQYANIEGIEYFLSEKCPVDVKDMYGWTPLMCATFEGHYNVVEYLLKKGAKVDLRNKEGLSAFDIAVKQKNAALSRLLQNGVIEDKHVSNNKTEEVKFCESCKITYVESITVHERSIAHLLSTQNDNMSSTYYHIPENNKGFQIMLKKGWDKNKGLGPEATGRKFPIKTILKTDRTCIGGKKEIAKVTHFGPNDCDSVKKTIQPTLNLKKERKLKKSERKKLEQKNRSLEINFRRQFHAND